MKHIVSALLSAFILTACNNQTTKTNVIQPAVTDTATALQGFFPVPDYIGGELKMIDSLQLPISKTVTINSNSKLSAATDNELRELAQLFRQPDINSAALKKLYKQTSIADQATPLVTLIFTTADTTLEIQKMNVYVKPDPVNNDKVTGIYIEKIFNRNDTSFNQQLYWKTGKNMQVTTEKKVKGKKLPLEQIKIAWDY